MNSNGVENCAEMDSEQNWYCSLDAHHYGPHEAFVNHDLSGEFRYSWGNALYVMQEEP